MTSNVAALACREGLAVQGSATEIPQATARAVTHSFVACFAFSGIAAVIFYYYF
ncbi:MAG: ABC transporter permease [candidate division NC10 bacterium]|nr:ABC transporter permease [candidate division NC10 bacterium]